MDISERENKEEDDDDPCQTVEEDNSEALDENEELTGIDAIRMIIISPDMLREGTLKEQVKNIQRKGPHG